MRAGAMGVADLGQGWYIRKSGFAVNNGPYPWTDLVSFARSGDLVASDFVWHESWPEWRAAGAVAELGLQPQRGMQPAAPVPPRKRGHGWIVTASIVVGVLLLGGLGTGAWFLLAGGDGGGQGSKLGAAEHMLPDENTLVATEWGVAPPNQIGVVVAEGGKRRDAEKVADELGGKVVGELESIGMYQIEFPGTTSADLVAALDTAKTNTAIELAFPNSTVDLRAEIWGVRQDPFTDPFYGKGAGDGLAAIGVSKAWSYIRGGGIETSDVHVGVVDDGLYAPGEGAESEFGGDVTIDYPDGEENAVLGGPRALENGKPNPGGSHGTGVATVIAADPNNGGPSGIAGPLGKKLTVSITNQRSGNYGITTSTPDPDDPTKLVWGNGVTYSLGNLVALQSQVKAGATVINCSWGADDCHPDLAAAYKKFFEKMAADKPGVIFVCAAGNTNKTALDNRRSFPCGHNLPNMLTVGAVDNDGQTADYSTIAGDNYVVDLAAPGTEAVVGMDDTKGGSVRESGTSFASPEVAAAAAILKSLNPKLTAQQVKDLLLSTARTSIKTGDSEVAADANVGGKVLAIDQAVFKVVNDMRKAQKLPPLSAEEMEAGGVVDAVAITGKPGEYTVKGIVKAPVKGQAKLAIAVTGASNSVGGSTTQGVTVPGEVTWSVTLPDSKGTIRVTRADNGAASLIILDRGPLEGTWEFPETMKIAGGTGHFQTGAMIKMPIVRNGDGYAMEGFWTDTTVTLEGDRVTIVHTYAGLDLGIFAGTPGGTSTYTGTLSGDTITGTCVDTYNGTEEWIAKRVE